MRGEDMSVLIKGFKMPEDCRDCPLEMYYMNSGETRCRARNKILAENFKAIPFDGRPDWCPLVEVLVPHGDLIDRNALIEFCAERWIPLNVDAVNMQPTIIEAEEGDEE